MSDGSVVAFVPVAGRVQPRASLVDQALYDLVNTGLLDRIFVIGPPESEMDIPAGLPVDTSVHVMPDFVGAVASMDAATRVVLVHDPLRTVAPAELIRRVVAEVVAHDAPVVPVAPCSDTVKRLDDAGFVVDTPDRAGLRVVRTPIGYPADAVRSGTVRPGEVPVGARTVGVA